MQADPRTDPSAESSAREWKWDAFISYAQGGDAALARALRGRLQSFARAPFALRRARVFLDKSSLPAADDLPRALQEALRDSRYLIVICSPEAVRSSWVARELQTWFELHGNRNILLVLAAGCLVWRDDGFSPEETTALPAPLHGVFKEEPLWVDMTWARGQQKPADMPAMRDGVARLASAILNLPLDEIEGDDVRSNRLLRRLRLAAIVSLALLALLSMTCGILADRNRKIAMQRALAFTAQAAVAGTPSLPNAQRAAAHVLAVNPEARNQETWGAALAAVQALPTAVIRDDAGVSSGAFRPRSQDFAIAAGQRVSRHDRLGRRVWRTPVAHEISVLAWSPSGDTLAAVGRSREIAVLSADGAIAKMLRWPPASPGAGDPVAVRGASYIDDDRLMVFSGEGIVVVDVHSSAVSLAPESIDMVSICGTGAAWSRPDGTVLSTSFSDASGPRIVHRHAARVTFLACAAGGASVASVAEDDLLVWTRSNRPSEMQLHGVRAIALASTGDRLAVNTSQVLQSGRYESEGSNETLLFANDAGTILWRAERNPFSTVIGFDGDDLLIADDQSALLRVEARNASRVDSRPTSAQIDHMVGLSNGGVLVVTKDGIIEEVNFDAGTRRPRGRTTGWATSLTVSDDRHSFLLFSLIDGAEVTDHRHAAVLIALDEAAGPLYFDEVREAAIRDGSAEIVALHADPVTGTRVGWTLPSGAQPRESTRPVGQYESVSLSADGEHVLLWGRDGALMTDLDGRELWRDGSVGVEPVFVGTGASLLLRSEAPQLLLAGTRGPIPLPFETGNIGTIHVTRNLQFAYAVVEGRHELWDLRSGRRVYAASPNASWSASFAPDESLFVAAVEGGGVDVVDLRGLDVRHMVIRLTIDGQLIFGGDGRELLVPGREGLKRADVSSGEIADIDAPGGSREIAAAPGGKGLVVAYPDDSILLFDGSYRPIQRLSLSGTLAKVAFSRDGVLVALGSHDGGVRLVDLRTGRILGDIRAGTGAVVDVTFVDEDRWLFVDGEQRAVLVPMDPYSRLCRRAARRLSSAEWKLVGGWCRPPQNCR